MNKEELLTKARSLDRSTFDKERLISWISSLPSDKAVMSPISYKKGDVLMHGAFQHPYVLLRKKNDYWICGILTTESTCTEIMEPCESRFYSSSFFTRTIFTVKDPIGKFMSPYENSKQINNILKQLKSIFN